MIGDFPRNRFSAVQLLQKQNPGQFVRQGHWAKGYTVPRHFFYCRIQPERTSHHKTGPIVRIIGNSLEKRRKILRCHLLAMLVQNNGNIHGLDDRQNPLAFKGNTVNNGQGRIAVSDKSFSYVSPASEAFDVKLGRRFPKWGTSTANSNNP